MTASDGDGCGDELVAGEHRGGDGGGVGDGERDVGLAAGFDAGDGRGPAKAEREIWGEAHRDKSIKSEIGGAYNRRGGNPDL